MMPPARSVACPRCGAQVGETCMYPNGTERASHQERVSAYLATPAGDPWSDDANKSDDSTPGTVNTG